MPKLVQISSPVDLQTQAVELAKALQSLRTFPDAARSLLATIRSLSSELFQRQIRKIITIIEIARGTLIRAGVKLHTFTSCPAPLQPLKSEYFSVLRALKERQKDIVERQDRATRLLLPLDSWLVIRRSGSSSDPSSPIMGASMALSLPSMFNNFNVHIPVNRLQRSASSGSQAPKDLMPPPPLLPWEYRAKLNATNRGRPLQRSGHLSRIDPTPYARTRNPLPSSETPLWQIPDDFAFESEEDDDSGAESEDADTEEEEVDDENQRPPVLNLHCQPRRFGIFCTAKSGYERSSERGSTALPLGRRA